MNGWICYPIWGLEMSDNGHGLEMPIFGDATIVPRSYLQKYAPSDPMSTALMSGGGMRAAIESSGAEMAGPAPIERLIDIPPGAFIAVRRKNPDDAMRYAGSIRAFLTATSVLTSGQAKGFSMTPLPLHWSAMPSQIRLNVSGLLEAQYRVIASNFIHLTPVVVTHKQLRDSWENGTPVHGAWIIHKEGPFGKVLVGDATSKNGLRRRIRDAASILARAMESTDTTMSTLFSVVALESLLKEATGYDEFEDLATCIFIGANGREEISRLFSNRHKVAHEAKGPDAGDEAKHSREIAAAWMCLLMAAVASEDLSTPPELIQHLRGRVLAQRVAKQLRDKDQNGLADKVEYEATFIGKKSVSPDHKKGPV